MLKDKSSQNTHPYNRYNHDGSKLLCLAWTGGPPAIPGLSSQHLSLFHYQGSTTPRQVQHHTIHTSGPSTSTATDGYDSQGSLPIPFHSPITYLPRQISIYLNAIETKYVQVPSWPLYHTVPRMPHCRDCRVCIQMQAEQANWCKLLLVATPQPGGRTLHRKACVLWLRPRSHCRSFVNSSVTTLWHTYCCSIFPFHHTHNWSDYSGYYYSTTIWL